MPSLEQLSTLLFRQAADKKRRCYLLRRVLARLNERPFRQREGSRRSLFKTLDHPALKPLPAERYQYGQWKTVRVNIDYLVEFDRHWQSVPHQLTRRQVEIRDTASTVEIFHQGVRLASHARSHAAHRHTTIHEHRPKSHQRYLEWTPPRIIEWSGRIGDPTLADSIPDRLVHNAHRIELQGESMRKQHGRKPGRETI